MKDLIILFTGITLIVIFFSWVSIASIMPESEFQSDGWKAPPSAKSFINPLSSDDEATDAGKPIYDQFCAVCHGKKGKGDGMAGISLKPRPTNFLLEDIKSQTDGEIFWKITEGRSPMASYKEALTDLQRWKLVNYIRQLGN